LGERILGEVRRRRAQDLVLIAKRRFSRRSWTRSFCSAVLRPSLTPSSTLAWRIPRRTDSTEMSKSAATSATVSHDGGRR
jgi:hypothetical protein